GRMALHAVLVRIRTNEMNGFLGLFERHVSVPRDVEPNVTHASELGENGTEHAVVGVARVAVVLSKKVISRVARGERSALRVVRIGGVGDHHVTGAAEPALLGRFEALDVARSGDTDWKDSEPEQKPNL